MSANRRRAPAAGGRVSLGRIVTLQRGARPGPDPCLSECPFTEIGEAHPVMRENSRSDGNVTALVSVPSEGLTDLPVSQLG
jgi:hypothetical protein